VALAVGIGLGLLAFFKYFNYAAEALVALGRLAGLGAVRPLHLEVALPLGISFYTFEAISYAIDVYRGRLEPTRRPRNFLLFISFFPHLVAGPIVRAGDFLYQIGRRRRPRMRVMGEGAYLMIRGFFLKVVVADNLAAVVDASWSAAAAPGGNASLSLLVTVLFGLQIFCDFEGYSTIARGAAYLLGFRLPTNFNSPYIAGTFRSFWERWHITLSRWLRDYLYLPLGGNRVSRPRLFGNLMVVMLLGGLWHGAANTFLVWGALHGAALAVERALGLHTLSRGSSVLGQLAWFVVVQVTVLVAWVFFRSADIATATGLLANLVGGQYGKLPPSVPVVMLGLVALPPLAGHLRTLLRERFGVPDLSVMEKAVWGAGMLYASLTAYGPTTTFIYFQF